MEIKDEPSFIDEPEKPSLLKSVKKVVIGKARSPHDPRLFHKLSLIAFFAWVGLGADGLSSSSYGPEEAFRAMGQYSHLAIFVAIASVVTVLIISASYSQIIELFPTGGGGYLVASKLLSPTFGMVGGCALIVDYVLTIAISVASGADAVFSFLPVEWLPYKIEVAVAGVIFLILINLRGVKESVAPLVPIFLTFVVTHLFAIVYAVATHADRIPDVYGTTIAQARSVSAEIGVFGLLFLLVRAYSMGAGTYTGIEAVSNGLPILRDPKVETGKRTMRYMAASLAFTVLGLMIAYVLYDVAPAEGKTLNAVLFEALAGSWNRDVGYVFVLVTLASEAAILFVAAQTGFLGGPRVLANMAQDRWFPTKFAMLSDRLVTHNGIILMGGAALVLMVATGGSVAFLVVLYAINVFITFSLSLAGMVRHWWRVRGQAAGWRRKIAVSGTGFVMTAVILVSVTIAKFHEGGWITIFITGALVLLVQLIKRHYEKTGKLLRRLDSLVAAATIDAGGGEGGAYPAPAAEFDPNAPTAVLFVNGFNGLGLHTLFNVIRLFRSVYDNFVFAQIGVIDADVFKGQEEVENLKAKVGSELDMYVSYMRRHGFHAESFSAIGTDLIGEVMQLAPKIAEKYPKAVFFGGQIVFPEERFFSRWLHNYVVFAMQRRFYHRGVPFIILPIRV